MAIILEGTAVAKKIKGQLKNLHGVDEKNPPCLVIIRFGNNEDDISYQKNIAKRCDELNVRYLVTVIDNPETFVYEFDKVNNDERIDGIIIMGSYPNKNIKEYVQRNIDIQKDVDGIGYENIAKLYSNDKSAIIPCTVEAVLRLLEFYNIEVSGKKVCILGRSLIVGKPLAMCLINRDATVTICHSKTVDVKTETKQADIILTSIGVANYINADFVTENSIIIDIGINFDENGKICGDTNFEIVQKDVKAITPVPRGVGSITNAILISHVYDSYFRREVKRT